MGLSEVIIIITLIPVTIFAKVLYRACQATSHLCGQHSNSFLDNLKNYPYMCNVWLLFPMEPLMTLYKVVPTLESVEIITCDHSNESY